MLLPTDITIHTTSLKADYSEAVLYYDIDHFAAGTNVNGTLCSVEIYDADGERVAMQMGFNSTITIRQPKLWWPYLMEKNAGYGYQYTMKVSVNENHDGTDIYR